MGVFGQKIAKAKAAFGANYGREGRYWVVINSGKEDLHASKNSPQIIYEGTVIRVVDPGPPAGARFKTSKGGNETPHAAGEPFTFHFGMWQLGAEARAKRFLLTAGNMEEAKLPAAIDPTTGAAVAPGTPGSVDPIEYAVEMTTNPKYNMLKDAVIEVHGRGQRSQGRNNQQPQDIIAVDPVRRVWAREVQEVWDQLAPTIQADLAKDGRLTKMVARDDAVRAQSQAPAAAGAPK